MKKVTNFDGRRSMDLNIIPWRIHPDFVYRKEAELDPADHLAARY